MMQLDKTKKRRALAALEELGMDPKFVLIVLKDSLKSHDWQHLEANNFTLLANLVFERQATQEDQELYEDDSAHGRFEQHIDACFEDEPACSIERKEKRSFEATTLSMFKRPKVEGLNIAREAKILPNVPCRLDSTSSEHAKFSSLDNVTPFSGNLSSSITKALGASSSVVQCVQKGNNAQVQPDSNCKPDLSLKGTNNCTVLCKPEVKIASSEKKLSRADKLQEEALAGWNLRRDEEKNHLQHEREKSELPSCSSDTCYNADLCATSCDFKKESRLTSIEENSPALNLLMEIYSGSGDSSESAGGHFGSNRLVTSNNFSIVVENEVCRQDKEFILENESKKLDLRNLNEGENFSRLFDEQKANCGTQSKDSSLPSVVSVVDEVRCGSFVDGTSISKMPTENIGKKLDTLDVHIGHSSFVNLDVDSTSRHNSFDISRGEESIPIPLAKDVVRKLPSTFYYASKSHIYQNALVKFSLAKIREDECCSLCFGDCLNSPIPCACAKETGGEYAYNADGFLCDWFLRKVIKEKVSWDGNLRHYCPSVPACPFGRLNIKKNERCTGHLHRSFVKECWTKCGCDKSCGNRVVQRGVRCRLEVFWDPHGKGWGVRTMENIPAGAFVCEYAGEILTVDELEGRERSRSGYMHYSFPLLLDADLGSEHVSKNEEALCLDNTNYGNIARFINHRCYDANMVDIPVLIESFDRRYYHVAYFTNRPVKALEELTWDYQIDFNDRHSLEAFQCLCESRFCRGQV